MGNNWIYNLIMGEDEPAPARPVPAIPIIDTRVIIDAGKRRTTGLTRQLDRCATRAAVEKIFGGEMLTLIQKVDADSAEEPSTNTNELTMVPVPEHIADPRKIECRCPCRMCQSGSDCYNCLGDEDGVKCEFSTLRVLDDLIPVDPEQQHEEMEQATKRQRKRIAQMRVDRHRKGLEPAFEKLRRGLPYAYRPGVIAAMNKVHDATAQFCAEHC
jgi:hypothetical protein